MNSRLRLFAGSFVVSAALVAGGCKSPHEGMRFGLASPPPACLLSKETEFSIAASAAKSKVLRELFVRVDSEQRCMIVIADATASERSVLWPEMEDYMDATLRDNANWLKSSLKKYPLFSIQFAGAQGSRAAWLVVQHSDHDVAWQEAVMGELEKLVAQQDFDKANYALLVDRVAVNRGRPQTFGTQGKCQQNGQWVPKPIADEKSLDDRRHDVGLGNMSDYIKRFKCS